MCGPKQRIQSLILKHVPVDIYQTTFEIQTFLEQLNEDIEWQSVRVVVGRMYRAKMLKRREIVTPILTKQYRGIPAVWEYCKR